MKTRAFASRNFKEIIRDRINLIFGIGFPVVLLLLLTAIQSNVPVKIFALEELTPGIAVFGLSFISLFSAILISKDRDSSFLARLFSAPLTAKNFIMGYTLPLLPLSIMQIVICYLVAFLLGLPVTVNVIYSIIVTLPVAFMYIGIGLLVGSLLKDKQVGGVCGALLTNLTAWLSGTWFDLSLVGGTFKTIAYLFPFAHAVDAGKAALAGDFSGIFPHIFVVIGYGVVIFALAIFVFSKKMKGDNK